MPSRRTTSPAPSSIGSSSETSHRRQDSFGSYTSEKEKETPRSNRFDDHRKALNNHPLPSRKSSDSPTGSSSKPHSPTVNHYTYCGRHSDQYLFSGWSNLVKAPFKKS
ncbi:hypothetical protein F5Y06DRAFT_149776 [Hypoxylon sp. FL0890]|nr:hypothetical protein F5Y06DRAFT_149776 [Hypoxylon sp. FL0890]